MNSKSTGIWFVIAAALVAFIFFFERYLHPAVTGPAPLLSGLRPAAVTGLQVFPAGAMEISAARTNGGWVLTRPVSYSAQAAAIEALLDALQKLAPAKIGAAELRDRKLSDADFGFDKPQVTLVVSAGDQSWQLKVGNKTAPGDQVYLQVTGTDGVDVADAGWLGLLPHAADEWRDTALVTAAGGGFDWLVLTNGAKVIELRRDPTNHLWRMTRPLQARADTGHITDAMQRLATAHVTQFLADNPKADPALFGLQPADLDLWLGSGTNLIAAIHVGKNPTNDPAQVFATRGSWNTVFTTDKDPLLPWYGAVNSFRDSNLFELTAPVAEIEVRGASNHFILREQGSNDWKIVGEKYPADAGTVQAFVQKIAGLRVAEFVKAAVTAPDLAAGGFDAPQREIILRSKAGDTNTVIAQLAFGANEDDKVFVRCAGEDFIYAVTVRDFNQLQEWAWEFRDLRIWNFKVDDLAQITIHQDGRTRQIVHSGPGKWSLAAGSQGLIEGKYIEQTVEQLCQLSAAVWVPRSYTGPDYGFGTNCLQITFELKNGEKDTVDFGSEFGQRTTALAAVTLGGERLGFVFPKFSYPLVLSYLTIPVSQGGMP